MLAIRLQRTGRKGHAQFRIIVQDAHRSPSSGNVVMRLGNYDPHTKAITVDKEKSAFYLEHGAQPSPRVAYLLQKEGVKLPSWVTIEKDRQRAIKNTEKLRRNRTEEAKPAEAPAEPEAEKAVESESGPEALTDEPVVTTAVEETTEAEPTAEVPTEEEVPAAEEPAVAAEDTNEASAKAEATPAAKEAEPEVPSDQA